MAEDLMYISYGVNSVGGKYSYNILFYFPESEDTFTAGNLMDKYNYFESKTFFGTKSEAMVYGEMVSNYINVLFLTMQDAVGAGALMAELLTKTTCPESVKESVEKKQEDRISQVPKSKAISKASSSSNYPEINTKSPSKKLLN